MKVALALRPPTQTREYVPWAPSQGKQLPRPCEVSDLRRKGHSLFGSWSLGERLPEPVVASVTNPLGVARFSRLMFCARSIEHKRVRRPVNLHASPELT